MNDKYKSPLTPKGGAAWKRILPSRKKQKEAERSSNISKYYIEEHSSENGVPDG